MVKIGVFSYLFLLGFNLAAQEQRCKCDSYDAVLKEYRAAKDAGNNERTEQVAYDLSQNESVICRIQGLNLLANVRVNNSELPLALQLLERQRFLLDSMACGEQLDMEYFLTKSFFHYVQDEYDSSIANSLKALQIAEQTNSITHQITLRLGIGSAFYRTGQQDKKMEYARSIIPLIEQVDDQSFKCQYYFNLFGAYYTFYNGTSKDPIYLDSADLYNKKALRIALATSNRRFLPYCYEALEIVNAARGGSPQKGLVYIDSAIFFGRNSISGAQLSELLLNKASLLKELGLLAQSKSFTDSALFYSARQPQKSVYASHLLDASELLGALGEHEKALVLYKQADVILDSIKSIKNTGIVRELEEKYNKEKNEKAINQLSQERTINQLQIRLLYIGVSAAVVVIILVVLIYRWTLIRQRQQTIESKYRLNQALVNPHFLSNALVSIQRFMLENNAQLASGYLTKFSKLMRQLLESSRKDLIGVQEEIDLLKNYLEIQKLRFKGAFDFDIKVVGGDDHANWEISPMFVQPFVENAVEHGIKGVDAGKIEIAFTRLGSRLEIIIQDNGRGLGAEGKQERQSMSTDIIRERIDLLNKTNREKIELSIGEVSGGPGTKVRLVLPIY